MFIFEDGRIIYDAECLTDNDAGKYITVEELPPIPAIDGKYGYHVANLTTGEVDVKYREYTPVPIPPDVPQPEPIYQPTEGELLIMKSQAAMYEELQESKLSQMKANADIYEAILSNGGTI